MEESAAGEPNNNRSRRRKIAGRQIRGCTVRSTLCFKPNGQGWHVAQTNTDYHVGALVASLLFGFCSSSWLMHLGK